MKAATRAGADAFQRLIRDISAQITADFAAQDEDEFEELADPRNYPALVLLIEASLHANFVDAAPSHRQGFVRAITDLLVMHVDGVAPGDEWDPLKSSEAAFMAPSWTIAAIASAQHKPMPNRRD